MGVNHEVKGGFTSKMSMGSWRLGKAFSAIINHSTAVECT
jgi:hypothetical protein